MSGGMQAQEGGSSSAPSHWWDGFIDWIGNTWDSLFGGGGGGAPNYNDMAKTFAQSCPNGVDHMEFVYGGNGSAHVEVTVGGVVEVIPVGASGSGNIDNSHGEVRVKCK